MSTTMDPHGAVAEFYGTVDAFCQVCESAGIPVEPPAVTEAEMSDAWSSLDGLDTQHLVESTTEATGLNGIAELHEQPFALARVELGEDGASEQLAQVDATYQQEREAASELVDDAARCSDAVEDIMHTSTLSVTENLSMGTEMLTLLVTLIEATPSDPVTETLAVTGTDIMEQTISFTQATIHDRDDSVSSALEAFADACVQHCEALGMEPVTSGIEKVLVKPAPEPMLEQVPEPVVEPVAEPSPPTPEPFIPPVETPAPLPPPMPTMPAAPSVPDHIPMPKPAGDGSTGGW